MEINVQVTKDNVCFLDNDQVHENEVNVDTLVFSFSEEYTDDLVKIAVFTNFTGTTYRMTILNNKCAMPYEALLNKGLLTIGVYAFKEQDGELMLRYSPTPLTLSVEKGSYIDGQDGTVLVPAMTLEEYEQAIQEALTQFELDKDAIIQEAKEEFDTYYNGKVDDFDTNATNKTNTFNNNATDKTNAYNSNATDKTNSFNSNATSKATDYNNNATLKTSDFNTNATNKTNTFNDNATNKTTAFNDNATDKTTAYNNNAQAKVDYYDQHASEIIEMNELNTDQFTPATVSDTTIHVSNSSNLPLKEVRLGNNCKNLAWTGWAEDFVERINNENYARIETFDNKNCLYWAQRAGSGDYDNKYWFKIKGGFKENTRYTFSLDFYSLGNQGYANLLIEYTDGTTTEWKGTYNAWSHKETTSTAGKTIKYLRVNWRANGTYLDIDTFTCAEGTTVTNEPYTVITGDNTVKVTGKNLFDKNATPNYVQSGVVKSINANGELVLTYTGTTSADKYQNYSIFVRTNLKGKVIRFKGIWEASGSNKGRIILRENGNAAAASGTSGNTVSYTITDDEPVAIGISLYVNYSGTLAQGDTITFKEITVTIDDEDMTYEPYTEQTVTLPLGTLQLTPTDEIYNDNGTWKLTGTEITDENLVTALNNLEALRTYRTITNIFSSNSLLLITATYRKDLTTQIQELINAILSLGNNT